MKLAELGEFGLIGRIRSACGDSRARLGIGDDCAAMEVPPGELLLTSSDLLLEEIHFRLDWTDYYALGRKAVAVNVSDVAAMGGAPKALFLGLAAPPNTEVAQLDALLAGICDEARCYGAELLGGDTCRSLGGLMLAITVQGHVPAGELVRRSGAEVGDQIWVSGELGDSAWALAALLRGEPPQPQAATRHHRPQARVTLGRALAQKGLAKAMIDVSDGLLADLGHLLQAASLGAVIDVSRVPFSTALQTEVQKDPQAIGYALHGGEDYELLFCCADQDAAQVEELAARHGLRLTAIGTVRSKPGLELCGVENAERVLKERGFDHFHAAP